MSTMNVVPSNPQLVSVLQAEELAIDKQIGVLSQRKQVLNRFRTLYSNPLSPTPQRSNVVSIGKSSKPKSKGKHADGYSTMEMARRVIDNADRELPLADIKEHIRSTFGVPPAKSLDQMLYKRAHAKKGFYRLSSGAYGLSEWRKRNTGANGKAAQKAA